MSEVIYKYELKNNTNQTFYWPSKNRILKVGEQFGKITLWVLQEDTYPSEYVTVVVIATGQEIEDSESLEYIDTILMNSGLVWHIFKRNN